MATSDPWLMLNAAPRPREVTDTTAHNIARKWTGVFAVFIFGPDAVRCGFLVSVADRLGRAVVGLLKLNLWRIKTSARIIFDYVKINIQKMLDRREG